MRKQALVIGLGQFGMSLARSLADKGVEVLAVDRRDELVQSAAEFAAEAVACDAADEAALARMAPARRDLCVCAIGDESRESSIICTALLRQMGARRVIARANTALHERILYLVGAHEVVNPEREFGERFSNLLVYEGMLGELRLGEGLLITELRLPLTFAGRTLKELELPRHYGLTVVAIRREGEEAVVLPDPNKPLQKEDILVFVSREGAVGKLIDRT